MSDALRESIIGHLRLISSLEKQAAYEADVPIANVPAELVSGWFDDLYFPDSELFQSAFSELERQSLFEFHEYFSARVDRLPTDQGLKKLRTSPEWQDIVLRSQAILTTLGWSQDAA